VITLGITQFSYGATWEEFLKAAAELGTPAAELFVYDREVGHLLDNTARIQRVRDAARSAGVAIQSLCVTTFSRGPRLYDEDPSVLAEAEGRLISSINTASQLGARVVLIPGAPDPADVAAVERFVNAMRKGAVRATELGVRIGWEQGLGSEHFLTIADSIGSDAVGDYLDTGHVVGRGGDLPAEIKERQGRIVQVHAKGVRGVGFDEGTVDLESALRALITTGYDGYVMLETRAPAHDVALAMGQNYHALQAALTRANAAATR